MTHPVDHSGASLRSRPGLAAALAGLAGLLLTNTLVVAADAARSPATAAEDTLEEIVITGTSIRGIAPVGSPVVSIGAEQIANSGLATTTDVLRSIPQVFNLGASEGRSNTNANNANANTFFAEGINLRGLGPQATLVLVNGQRPAPQGIQAAFFDVSSIPSIALSGIEVVADGASAIYGADAVAGVANMILRRDYDGATASVRYGAAKDYRTRRLAGLLGNKWSNGNFMLAAEYFDHPGMSADKRPNQYFGAGSSVSTLADTATVPAYLQSFAYPPTLSTGTGTTARNFAIPGGLGTTPPTAAQILANTGLRNVQSTWAGVYPIGALQRASVVMTLNQSVGERYDLYGQAFYSKRRFYDRAAAAGTTTLTVSSARNPYAAFLPSLPGAPTTGRVAYSFIDLLGPGWIDGHEVEGQLVLGSRIKVFSDWQLDISVGQNYSQDDRFLRNQTNQCALTGTPTAFSGPCTGGTFGVIGDTTLTGALNPFGTSNAAVADKVRAYTEQKFQVNLRNYNAKLDGTVFRMPGGEAKAAVGAAYIDQTDYYRNVGTVATADASVWRKNTGGQKTQKIRSAFVELVMPFVGRDNARPGVRSLQLALAGRIDDYSLYSSATKNPKIGITWKPTDDLLLRASYGKSFRSSLKDIDPDNAPNVTVSSTYFDYRTNGSVNAIRWLGGNPNLRPETSSTTTFGVEFNPQALPGLHAGATYFSINYDDIIDQPGGNIAAALNSAAVESVYSAYVFRRPAATDVAGTAAYNALVAQLYANTAFQGSTVAQSAIQIIVDNRGANAGSLRSRGLDLNLAYDWKTGMGDLLTALTGTYFFKFDRSLTPTDSLADRINQIDFPTRYQARLQLGWHKGNVNANAFISYLPSYQNTNVTPVASVSSNTNVDLNVGYRMPDSSSALLQGVTLSFSAQNLFDRAPPYALIAAQTFDSNYSSPIGRIISFQVNKEF